MEERERDCHSRTHALLNKHKANTAPARKHSGAESFVHLNSLIINGELYQCQSGIRVGMYTEISPNTGLIQEEVLLGTI